MTDRFAGTHALWWIVARPLDDPNDLATHSLTWTDGKSLTYGGVRRNVVEFASADQRTHAYLNLDATQAASHRGLDAVAVSAAQALHADIFVTRRAYLLDVPVPLVDGVCCVRPEDALAVVGLYLRSCGEYVIRKDARTDYAETINKGLYYWVGARELLPSGWGWFSSCLEIDRKQAPPNTLPSDLTFLAGAVFQRLTRALQCRDDVLRAMSLRQDNDVAEDALIGLDTCLIFLMGALDAAARVANRMLRAPADDRTAGWQKRQWLKLVRQDTLELAEVLDTEYANDTLTILSLLRNTVHGPGLPSSRVSGGRDGQPDGTMMRLPKADEVRILDAVHRQGGENAWGLRMLGLDQLHADPAVLLEKLLPATVSLLNDLLAKTPVERRLGHPIEPEKLRPPADPHDHLFSEEVRLSIRWQLGL